MPDDAALIARYLAERDTPCPACGFNLRGVRDAACPECGRRLGLSMLLLDEQHAIPMAGKRVADACQNLRLAEGGLLVLAIAIGAMSFPSITDLLVASFMLVLAAVCEGVVRWYRVRLAERAMHESLVTAAIDRYALAVAVLIAIPSAVTAMIFVAWILVQIIGL